MTSQSSVFFVDFARLLIRILFCAAAVACVAQQSDLHITQDPAMRLYLQSPFAHGYAHGYELGYHSGDLDTQLAHAPQNVKNDKNYKSASRYYRQGYGDKSSFVEGYEAGFRMGYADGYAGVDYRAVLNMRQLAQDLPEIDPKASGIMDSALARGYLDGKKNGLGDGRANANYRPDGSDCDLALRFKEAPAKFFCSVYSLGYRFGYSDGFHNQRPEPVDRRVAGEQ